MHADCPSVAARTAQACASSCTQHSLNSLNSLTPHSRHTSQYLERKRRLIADGRWAKASQHVTQYHDVLGFFLGKQAR